MLWLISHARLPSDGAREMQSLKNFLFLNEGSLWWQYAALSYLLQANLKIEYWIVHLPNLILITNLLHSLHLKWSYPAIPRKEQHVIRDNNKGQGSIWEKTSWSWNMARFFEELQNYFFFQRKKSWRFTNEDFSNNLLHNKVTKLVLKRYITLILPEKDQRVKNKKPQKSSCCS